MERKQIAAARTRRSGSRNVKAILNFSRCLVDGKVRELVTVRDVTIEESDFVYLHLFFKRNI